MPVKWWKRYNYSYWANKLTCRCRKTGVLWPNHDLKAEYRAIYLVDNFHLISHKLGGYKINIFVMKLKTSLFKLRCQLLSPALNTTVVKPCLCPLCPLSQDIKSKLKSGLHAAWPSFSAYKWGRKQACWGHNIYPQEGCRFQLNQEVIH